MNVWTVQVLARHDGLCVFADGGDAVAFAAAVDPTGWDVVIEQLPVNGPGMAAELIATEVRCHEL